MTRIINSRPFARKREATGECCAVRRRRHCTEHPSARLSQSSSTRQASGRRSWGLDCSCALLPSGPSCSCITMCGSLYQLVYRKQRRRYNYGECWNSASIP